MELNGAYEIWLPRPTAELESRVGEGAPADLIIPNLIPAAGAIEFLQMLMQNVSAIAGGANFYIGLCNQIPVSSNLLSDIISEPTVSSGYVRQAIIRSVVGWPTLDVIAGRQVIKSSTQTFTAAGGNFSAAFNRMFLTDQAAGTVGKLYSISGPLASAITLVNGQSYATKYTLHAA